MQWYMLCCPRTCNLFSQKTKQMTEKKVKDRKSVTTENIF